jgi:hypothetical protein
MGFYDKKQGLFLLFTKGIIFQWLGGFLSIKIKNS